jgi:multiple sugar transport system substrate-binding protein
MADTADEWTKIVRRTGEDKIIEAIQANNAAWPTVVDPI